MDFRGIRSLSIDTLGLSQLYISQKKYTSVMEWFDPQCLDRFQPVSVHDFGNGVYTLTDGHTRALAAYKSGVSAIPAVYDHDDIVTNDLGQQLYRTDIEWCGRFGLSHIKDLESRIVDQRTYEKLWIERCDRSYALMTKTTERERARFREPVPELFLYGASEDLSELYFENSAGDLFVFRENTLCSEKI